MSTIRTQKHMRVADGIALCRPRGSGLYRVVLALALVLSGCNASRASEDALVANDTAADPDGALSHADSNVPPDIGDGDVGIGDVSIGEDVEDDWQPGSPVRCEEGRVVEHRGPAEVAGAYEALVPLGDTARVLALNLSGAALLESVNGVDWETSPLEQDGPVLDTRFPHVVDDAGLLWGSADGAVVIAEVAEGRLQTRELWRAEAPVESLWVSSEGRVFAVAAGLYELRLSDDNFVEAVLLLPTARGALVSRGSDGFWGFESADPDGATSDLIPFEASLNGESDAVSFTYGSALVSAATLWRSASSEPGGVPALFGATEFGLLRCGLDECSAERSADAYFSRGRALPRAIDVIQLAGDAVPRILVAGHLAVDVFGDEPPISLLGDAPAAFVSAYGALLNTSPAGTLLHSNVGSAAASPLVIAARMADVLWGQVNDTQVLVGDEDTGVSLGNTVLFLWGDRDDHARRPALSQTSGFGGAVDDTYNWAFLDDRVIALASVGVLGVFDGFERLVGADDICEGRSWIAFDRVLVACGARGGVARYYSAFDGVSGAADEAPQGVPSGLQTSVLDDTGLTTTAGTPRRVPSGVEFFAAGASSEAFAVVLGDTLSVWRLSGTDAARLPSSFPGASRGITQLATLGAPESRRVLAGGGIYWVVAFVTDDGIRLEADTQVRSELTIVGETSFGVTLVDEDSRVWFWEASAFEPRRTGLTTLDNAWAGDFDQDGNVDLLVHPTRQEEDAPIVHQSHLYFGDCWRDP